MSSNHSSIVSCQFHFTLTSASTVTSPNINVTISFPSSLFTSCSVCCPSVSSVKTNIVDLHGRRFRGNFNAIFFVKKLNYSYHNVTLLVIYGAHELNPCLFIEFVLLNLVFCGLYYILFSVLFRFTASNISYAIHMGNIFVEITIEMKFNYGMQLLRDL